jgi:hypothetical protein
MYYVLTGSSNAPHITAIHDPLLLGRQMLVDRAGRQWSGDLVTLKGAIVRVVQFWKHFPDTEGIEFWFVSSKLSATHAEQEGCWMKMSVLEEQWRRRICGMTEDGWVSNEGFDKARGKMEEIKREAIEICDGDKGDLKVLRRGWPYRDLDEVN